MKNLLKLSALAAVLVASATYASAASIQLGSYCSNCANLGNANTGLTLAGDILQAPGFDAQGNYILSPTGTTTTGQLSTLLGYTGSAATSNVLPNGVWSGPLPNSSWVSSCALCGPNPNGNGTLDPDQGFYVYQSTFDATAQTYTGTINLWADDTAAVFLNGTQIIGFGTLGLDGHCAVTAPTCVSPLATVNFSQLLLAGTNTLTIIDVQAGNEATGTDPAGVDFNGTLTAPTPEPSTLLMLGTGLMGGAGALFRRMRK